jgi:hypothetical protein
VPNEFFLMIHKNFLNLPTNNQISTKLIGFGGSFLYGALLFIEG